MKKLIIFLNFLLIFTILSAQTLTGNVSYISDGDTINMVTNNQKYKIRFYGIDTPEKTQEYGLEAKEFVHKRIANKNVKVEIMDTDRYGRKVGKIYYNGKYLNKEIVKNGYAWWYKNYAKNDKDLESAEKYARANKLGLWKSSNPIAPWDYRRGKKNKTTATSSSSKNLDSVVYVTKNGKKYHRKGCVYLKSVGGSYSLKEAEALGYEACSKY